MVARLLSINPIHSVFHLKISSIFSMKFSITNYIGQHNHVMSLLDISEIERAIEIIKNKAL